jgi:hypothetical protein
MLQNRHDDSFMNVESLFQFLLQRGKFLGQLALVAEQRAHFEKRPHDKDVDSRSPDRSPVSQTDNAVHPTASPHVVFIWTARALLSTFAAMIAPCSVKTYGRRRRPPWPELEMPIWYFKLFHSWEEI